MVITPKFGFWAVKIVIEAENDKGKIKKLRETHLYDAVNPTDAEAQATKEMEGTIYEWSIKGITKVDYTCIGIPEEKK